MMSRADFWIFFALVLTAITATVYDIKFRRIPNFITFSAAITGFLLHVSFRGFHGGIESMVGFLAGLIIFFIPYLMGGMGAGDVKLMAAMGTLLGLRTPVAIFLSVMAGGVLSILIITIKGRWYETFSNIYWMFRTFRYSGSGTFAVPFGVAIAFGSVLTLFIGR